jgi:hypothetical protein
MIKFLIDVTNFMLSLLFGGLAIAAGIMTVFTAVPCILYTIGAPVYADSVDLLVLIIAAVMSFMSYSITAALRGWPNPLGKYKCGSQQWNSY